MQSKFLYLSSNDIEKLAITPSAVLAAVESMFRNKSIKQAIQRPKISVSPRQGSVVQALLGVDLTSHTAAVKCVSVSPNNADLGLPNVQALIVLSETVSGQVKAVMNGTWITAVRTAACSALGAKFLASEQCTSIGFVGAGMQARVNLDALLDVFPNIQRISVYSRTHQSGQSFLEFSEARGLAGINTRTPRAAVEGHDIVVTTVSPGIANLPFLDPAWVTPGAYVAAVDLGRSWLAEEWGATFDLICTDDLEQSETRVSKGEMLAPGRFDAELGDLVLNKHRGRTTKEQKAALLFAGTALSDLAVANLVEQEAHRQNLGTQLLF